MPSSSLDWPAIAGGIIIGSILRWEARKTWKGLFIHKERLAVEKVRDHFFIEEDVMEHCLNEMLRARQEMLARLDAT